MFDFFISLSPVVQALIGTLFTWGLTALGSAAVFLRKNPSQKMLDIMLGFAAGVMIAASYWSLLAPAIDMSSEMGMRPWLPPAIGFLLGGISLRVIDRLLPHLHLGQPRQEAEGIATTWKRTTLLVLAITLHNIPEGMAVGVAFGAVAYGIPSASLAGAIALALGIGIQNFPEGMAVSMPLRREGFSPLKSFWYGQLSGIVEPIFGVLGAIAVVAARPILPYALAFAAGAMIFVVVEEVIPESQQGGNGDQATMGVLLGFTIMMILDVALG
ncbi:MAG: ZIP family metal transporter [Aminobacterium sp.]|uniref:ZIP family metal transporter n=1 Tax=Aminobacterium sp. TaxID=1872491 RepID=UPI001BCA96DF|nr:ZIP family metal transporter [Aminobacterium sp.]MDD3425521.1 ZIP family metal transporter [Aminobacterium sp.]MDD3706793.1 ZIP family metal transporter [Aminobacterium sp.]MDD4228610.1 ZIP family metal transporter [Aminobacterium sp.]MDD4551538.1 ZIP family metal transporter [Aminobacterium sp.]MEA4877802.1 ZIP family metal transporter [Aminobacterium sp.]